MIKKLIAVTPSEEEPRLLHIAPEELLGLIIETAELVVQIHVHCKK
jgi:hypothetical protein